jgi:hypothetical protein
MLPKFTAFVFCNDQGEFILAKIYCFPSLALSVFEEEVVGYWKIFVDNVLKFDEG